MELGLKDRLVLITGGSRGIGYAIAESFLKEGAQVVIVAQDAERLSQAVATLTASYGPRVIGHRADLAAAGASDTLANEFKNVDVLVNNAGSIPAGDIFDVDEDRWRASWDLKVFGYVNLMRAVYPQMRARRRGVIINVIGAGGERPQWRYIAGNAGNVALMGATMSLGGRSVDDGIRAIAINPGPVNTDRLDKILTSQARKEFGDAADWRQQYKATFPFGRPASAAEIADVVVFMASDRASYVSGTVVSVHGGQLYRQGW